jgi:chaperone BCS1
LNTLDGPGSKQGHIVILTTNAPDSLDKALYLPGRIELKVFLGYSTCVTAGITFMRIFGSDSRLAMSKGDLDRLGKRFGRNRGGKSLGKVTNEEGYLDPLEEHRASADG